MFDFLEKKTPAIIMKRESLNSYSFRIDDIDNLIFQMFTVQFTGDFTRFSHHTEFFFIFDGQQITDRRADIDLNDYRHVASDRSAKDTQC